MLSDEVELLKFRIVPIRERYYNEDTAWGVFEFTTSDDIPKYQTCDNPFVGSNSKQKLSTLCGKMQKLYLGSNYEVTAKMEYNDKFKQYQYVPITVVSIAPKGEEESITFLKSLTSETIARNIVKEYPNIIQEVIDGKAQELEYSKIRGVGEKSWKKIRESIIENYVISDIIVLLQPLGISFNMINKMVSKYENPALLKKQLDENPYILTSIRGLGFVRVDQIALKLKPELIKSKFRLEAYIKYYLTELGNNQGHTYVILNELKSNCSNNVKECMDLFDELIEHNSFLSIENNRVGLKRYKSTEDYILEFFKHRIKYKNDKFVFTEELINDSIKEVEEEQGFNYTNEQLEEIKNILNDEVCLLTGKAGTGKTSVMRGVLRIYKNTGFSISCCALAAKAAKRITEATGYNATTIHSMLGYQGENLFMYCKENPLPCDLLFLDEASMLNADLFKSLLSATKESTRIIICGDHKQLPPIGYANIFSDLLLYKKLLPIHELKTVMRQASKSGIISDGNKIRDGINPIQKPELKVVNGELKDMYYSFRENRENIQHVAINTFLKSVEKEGVDNVQIAVPRKKDCTNSTQEINRILLDKLIPNGKSISNGIFDFKVGAKVRQTVNNSDKNVFNGEIGYISKIYEEVDSRDKKQSFCEVEYKDLVSNEIKTVKYKQKDLNEIDLAYAMTTHTMQGSGYQTIIGIIDNTHYTLLDNCMLYTMITRAKKKCLLLAEPKAFLRCINTSHNERNTWLKSYIEN